MEKPVVAKRGPYMAQLEAGKTYWWCRCGLSKTQPYCDGSHEGTGIEPMEFTPDTDMRMRFCGCKATKRPPYCDGVHNRLP
ncbi:MAG TPA: CDGSH iron-sulfur domain-containing protein [Arenibaculum sp.]|nr:CDGSH iron-sulfur domain-containing protein [Arenibaculum sp.]